MIRRVAIVGLGAAARSIHIPALRKVDQLELVGGYDPHPAFEAPFPLFSSVDDLLARARPDLLVVATPPASHFSLARSGLAAGCHVFCEKPLTERPAEAHDLAGLAKAAGRSVFVNSEFPWMPIHSAAKKAMDDPRFGRLQFVSMHQTFLVTGDTEKGWRGQDLQRTFKEFGTHVLDLAVYFFGERPRAVRARMPRPEGLASPDLLNIVELEFSGDRLALIVLDRLSKGRHRYLDIRLDGEGATVETSIGGRMRAAVGLNAKTRRPSLEIDVAMGGRARLFRGERYETLATAPLDLFADATARLLRDALSAIERGEEPPCGLSQALHTLELMYLCYEAAADRQPRELRA